MNRYTFNPPEDELINYYLNNKITENDDPEEKQINEVNICHHEPADLPGLAKIESGHTWYFISPVEKFGKLNRRKRASKTGHWKITGNSCTIKDTDGNPIGLKKFLVFQENKNRRSSTLLPTTAQQHKFTWIIHEFHSFLHHPNKDTFVLCKLKKKTRSRSGVAVDASPAVTDLSLTIISDPILNDSLMLTHHKDPVEDYGGDYWNDLEELTPELDSSRCLDHSYQFDSNHWGSFAQTTHVRTKFYLITDNSSITNQRSHELAGLLRGENGHVYGQNTVENSNVSDTNVEKKIAFLFYWYRKMK
ncbi:hypothetical protein IGI04_039223 [Brassica rapa subsp. trilocularis]|uniref:NAC domain-containing protein n=1 Tax=Brassica rapa subsp. trilocularis TaxID=1813537 RepID=A0ABQ7KK81_BRACM|nr:hypothetical protein IGI04_039223 [Brassica rapa subsp. trilocularis]